MVSNRPDLGLCRWGPEVEGAMGRRLRGPRGARGPEVEGATGGEGGITKITNDHNSTHQSPCQTCGQLHQIQDMSL